MPPSAGIERWSFFLTWAVLLSTKTLSWCRQPCQCLEPAAARPAWEPRSNGDCRICQQYCHTSGTYSSGSWTSISTRSHIAGTMQSFCLRRLELSVRHYVQSLIWGNLGSGTACRPRKLNHSTINSCKCTIKLAHEGHEGMVCMKVWLREKAWLPRMDKQVDWSIRFCHPCQLVGPRSTPEPIRSSIIPKGLWTNIAADPLEIASGYYLFVEVYNYSR